MRWRTTSGSLGLRALWRSRVQRPILGGMSHFFDFLVPAALLAVLIALAAGLYALFRGGDFGRSYSNKLMRLRVLLQFIALIVLVAAAFWWRRGGA